MDLFDLISSLGGGTRQQPPQPGLTDTGLPPQQQPPQQNNMLNAPQSAFDQIMSAVGQQGGQTPQQPQQGGKGSIFTKLLSMFAGG